MIKNKKQRQRYFDEWVANRRSEGWQYASFFVPTPLKELIKKEIREWKEENQFYYRHPKQ